MSGAEEIRGSLDVLFEPGQVVELRALHGKKTESGYFDDHDALAEEAARLDERRYQVYVTLNEINPALLARANNRLVEFPKATTSDRDVVRLRWLPLDFDPVRPSNVSSSEGEHYEAGLRAKDVREYLRSEGGPDPLVADSGNGFHLLYPIDLPNTRESVELIKGTLEALAFTFDDDRVKLDTSVHNPARIWKLYGTKARKGDSSVPDRPHRPSKIVKIPKEVINASG